MLLVLAGCPYTDAKKTYLEAFPASVQIPRAAGVTVTFEAYARLRRGDGKILGDVIEWHEPSGGGVKVVPSSGRDVKIDVDASTAGTYEVKVNGAGENDVITVEVVEPVGDQARGPDAPVPSVVAVFKNGAPCPPDSTYSFVSGGNLGTREAACASTDQRVVAMTYAGSPVLWPEIWKNNSAGDDVVDAVAPGTRTVGLKAWLITHTPGAPLDCTPPTTTPDCLRLGDMITTANGIFQTNRVGLVVTWDNVITTLVDAAVTCADVQNFVDLDGDGVPANDRWQAGVVNLYLMVQAITTSSKGKWCWGPGQTTWQSNVIKYQRDAVVTSLAHELGHMFGLQTPWGVAPGQHEGHVDHVNGFGHDNLMFAQVDLSSSASRTRLSLGQVYRMHFDARSWLRKTETTVDCSCDPYASSCGRLSRDTRAIGKSQGTLDTPSQYCPSPPPP